MLLIKKKKVFYKKPYQNKILNSSAMFLMGKVSKSAEETLQSLSIHDSWTQFPEMFWSIRQISPPLSSNVGLQV